MHVALEDLLVALAGMRLVAELFVGLREQTECQRILLVGQFQLLDRGGVVAGVESHVSGDVRIKDRLIRIVAFIDERLAGRQMLFRLVPLSSPGRDTRLGCFPAKLPKILLCGG